VYNEKCVKTCPSYMRNLFMSCGMSCMIFPRRRNIHSYFDPLQFVHVGLDSRTWNDNLDPQSLRGCDNLLSFPTPQTSHGFMSAHPSHMPRIGTQKDSRGLCCLWWALNPWHAKSITPPRPNTLNSCARNSCYFRRCILP
jgi:hypothetical protein